MEPKVSFFRVAGNKNGPFLSLELELVRPSLAFIKTSPYTVCATSCRAVYSIGHLPHSLACLHIPRMCPACLPECESFTFQPHPAPLRPVPRGLDPNTVVEVTTVNVDNVMALSGYSSTCNNASASLALEAKVVRGTAWDKEVKKQPGDSFAPI